jgi:hypothetical protein
MASGDQWTGSWSWQNASTVFGVVGRGRLPARDVDAHAVMSNKGVDVCMLQHHILELI